MIRPLCMIDMQDKMLEKIIFKRLGDYIEQMGGISNNQDGFRRGRSAGDAKLQVKSLAEDAITTTGWKNGSKNYCAMRTVHKECLQLKVVKKVYQFELFSIMFVLGSIYGNANFIKILSYKLNTQENMSRHQMDRQADKLRLNQKMILSRLVQ